MPALILIRGPTCAPTPNPIQYTNRLYETRCTPDHSILRPDPRRGGWGGKKAQVKPTQANPAAAHLKLVCVREEAPMRGRSFECQAPSVNRSATHVKIPQGRRPCNETKAREIATQMVHTVPVAAASARCRCVPARWIGGLTALRYYICHSRRRL